MGWGDFFSISPPAFRIPEQPHPSHEVTVYAAELGKGTDTPLQQCQTLLVLQTRAQLGTLLIDTILILIPYTNLATHYLFVLILRDTFNRLAGKVLLLHQVSVLAEVTFLRESNFTPAAVSTPHYDEMHW